MATNGDQSDANERKFWGSFLILLLVLGGALGVICRQAFLPHQAAWNNDTSLGWMEDESARLPGAFFGKWSNLEFLGGTDVGYTPSLTAVYQMLIGPEMYMRTIVPFSMFFLGFGAWLFFRQLGFARGVCIVGGLAAGLNMHYFSNACWGLAHWCVAAGMFYIALALLVSSSAKPLWARAGLIGLSIGMVVMEAYDVGAIFSIYFGIFMVFYFLMESKDPVKAAPKTVVTGSVVVLFALLIASSSIYTLIGSTFTENAKTGKTAADKRQQWIFLTTYSFPKMESLRLMIPGLYGYRLQEFMTDTNKSSAYWGTISEDWRIQELESSSEKDRAQAAVDFGLNPEMTKILVGPQSSMRDQLVDYIKSQDGARRHTGSGDYVGELVILLAFFALFNTWRKKDSPFSKNDRQAIWFWAIAAAISLPLAWGRYASLFQFVAPLPFIRNIRNPIKYLHPLNLCVIIVAGYGLEALYRCYLRNPVARSGSWPQHIINAIKRAGGFEKKWLIGSGAFLGLAVMSYLIYSSEKSSLINFIEHSGFSADMAQQLAGFSIQQILVFVLYLGASLLVILGILTGIWSGRRAVWAWTLLGAIMIFDIARSDTPWVRFFDAQAKYSLNPVTEFLRQDPWEHRVISARRSPVNPNYDLAPPESPFGAVCHWWLENDYKANDIQALEIDQAPRMPELEQHYIGLFDHPESQDLRPTVRLWQLTNTKYILMDANLVKVFNQSIEPGDSFHAVMRFNLALKPGIVQPEDAGDLTIQTNDAGNIALVEYSGALPRARLYANWQVNDDLTTLTKLISKDFDPMKTVLVATNTPVGQSPTQPDADPGTVKIVTYHPKYIKLEADAKTSAVLLYNERIADHWNVWVDDKPSTVLRCNYIMRGVFVPAGHHTIVFRYQPPVTFFYVSVAAIGAGLLLVGIVVFGSRSPADASGKDKKN